MRLLRGCGNYSARQSGDAQPSVVTIGNFDGVHRGHQAILKQVVAVAKELKAIPTVITFEPHPEEHFQGENAPARLMSFAEKYLLLKAFGIQQICCLRFSASLSKMPAEDFVSKILQQKIATRHLIIGDDFHFGFKRQGNFAFLKDAGQRYGFEVTPTATVNVEGARISSTLIREALLAGNFQFAKTLMGNDYGITARVMHGDKRGRTIGFPTANLALGRKSTVLNGVYAVKGYSFEKPNELLRGVANVGSRPTVRSSEQNRLEVHWFDFDGDLYGQKLRVNIVEKIRDEKKFENIELLTKQIQKDSETAREILDNLGTEL